VKINVNIIKRALKSENKRTKKSQEIDPKKGIKRE